MLYNHFAKGGDGQGKLPGEESAWALLELTRRRFPDRKAGLIPMSFQREKIESSADASRVATPLIFPS